MTTTTSAPAHLTRQPTSEPRSDRTGAPDGLDGPLPRTTSGSSASATSACPPRSPSTPQVGRVLGDRREPRPARRHPGRLRGSARVRPRPAAHRPGRRGRQLRARRRRRPPAGGRTVIVCVPTPVDEHLVPDLTILRAPARRSSSTPCPARSLILTSTTLRRQHPGHADPPAGRARPDGRRPTSPWPSAPERIDPGNDRHTPRRVPACVGGVTPSCATEAAAGCSRSYAAQVHPVASTERGRDDQAGGEHVPSGQHRARERVRRHLRGARPRRHAR